MQMVRPVNGYITSEATKYFEAANLDAVQVQPKRDLFGDLRHRFPNAWYALSLLSSCFADLKADRKRASG